MSRFVNRLAINAADVIDSHSSTVGFEGLPQEPAVVEALAKSPDFVTYIPPTYSIPWAKEDYADPNLGPILKFIHTPWDRATELRIAVTPIYTSVFDIYWFQYGEESRRFCPTYSGFVSD